MAPRLAPAETDRTPSYLVRGFDTTFGRGQSVEPGKVFDRTVALDGVPDGYRAMDAREALKVLVKP